MKTTRSLWLKQLYMWQMRMEEVLSCCCKNRLQNRRFDMKRWHMARTHYSFRGIACNNSYGWLPSTMFATNCARFVITPPTKCAFSVSIHWPVETNLFTKDRVNSSQHSVEHRQLLSWHARYSFFQLSLWTSVSFTELSPCKHRAILNTQRKHLHFW